jgi:hypothetical protein
MRASAPAMFPPSCASTILAALAWRATAGTGSRGRGVRRQLSSYGRRGGAIRAWRIGGCLDRSVCGGVRGEGLPTRMAGSRPLDQAIGGSEGVLDLARGSGCRLNWLPKSCDEWIRGIQFSVRGVMGVVSSPTWIRLPPELSYLDHEWLFGVNVTFSGRLLHTKLTPSPCSLGLSATRQQYFSLRTNQPPATSHQYFSHNKSALAINHQPNEQTA